jgi:RNA polymerase sigma factor (sigma-70 family)
MEVRFTSTFKGLAVDATIRTDTVADLVNRCNAGDREAWEEFYSGYLPVVRRAVQRVCRFSPEELDDIVQDVFIHLFKALRQFDPARPLETYIVEITRRVGVSQFRNLTALKRGGLNPGRVEIDGLDSVQSQGFAVIASSRESQEDQLIMAQECSLLRRALLRISEECRNLLKLRYEQGLSYQEIQKELSVKEGTLRVRVQRCLVSLAKRYAGLNAGEVV